MPEARTTTEIIRETIRQNRFGEYLLYSFATLMIGIGAAALIVGMVKGQGLVGLAGCIESALFYPAMRSARRISEQNIAIQLLEIPLSIATTSNQAAELDPVPIEAAGDVARSADAWIRWGISESLIAP